jgi:chromate transporter
MKLLFLLLNFSRIGLFAIGGGLATLPFVFELADRAAPDWAWLTHAMIGDMLAVAQSLPGAIGVNFGAYTGFRYAAANGLPPAAGAAAAAIGLIIPCVVIISLVARALEAFRESAVVKSLFAGFRPAAAGLLSAAGLGAISIPLWNASASAWYLRVNWLEACIFAALFFFVHRFKWHPIVYIAMAGVLGVILKL